VPGGVHISGRRRVARPPGHHVVHEANTSVAVSCARVTSASAQAQAKGLGAFPRHICPGKAPNPRAVHPPAGADPRGRAGKDTAPFDAETNCVGLEAPTLRSRSAGQVCQKPGPRSTRSPLTTPARMCSGSVVNAHQSLRRSLASGFDLEAGGRRSPQEPAGERLLRGRGRRDGKRQHEDCGRHEAEPLPRAEQPGEG
jgi:hypothetical protein